MSLNMLPHFKHLFNYVFHVTSNNINPFQKLRCYNMHIYILINDIYTKVLLVSRFTFNWKILTFQINISLNKFYNIPKWNETYIFTPDSTIIKF